MIWSARPAVLEALQTQKRFTWGFFIADCEFPHPRLGKRATVYLDFDLKRLKAHDGASDGPASIHRLHLLVHAGFRPPDDEEESYAERPPVRLDSVQHEAEEEQVREQAQQPESKPAEGSLFLDWPRF